MPMIKSNSQFDSLLAMTAMFNDTELQALANKCQSLIADRERIKREELRQKLMENLQNALSDVLHNDFALIIQNTKLNPEEDECCAVCFFDSEDVYSIEMVDTK